MKKILILSTFFPPNTLTPSERIFSWAKYFNKYGLYPIIVTRIWNENTQGYHDAGLEAGKEMIKEVHKAYTVYYLPYSSSLLEKVTQKIAFTKLHFFYQIFLFIYTFLEPLFLLSFSPYYKKVYTFAKDLLKKENIHSCLISAGPFMLFKIGFLLKRTNKELNVFADYRDDWTTSKVCFNPNKRKALEIVRKYLAFFEKKWLASYTTFFSVSQDYVERISDLIKIKGAVIENGFMPENYISDEPVNKVYEDFSITYVGYLYPTQPIEIFINSIIKLINNNKYKLKVRFIGIKNQPNEQKRIESLINGYEKFFELSPRISKTECIRIQKKSHLLLLVGHKDVKGTPGSKMYEYLALRKPILVCPTDHDIVEDSLTKSGQGIIVEDEEDAYRSLLSLYSTFEKTGKILENKTNENFIKNFDRENIAKRLAEKILNENNL